MSRVERMSSRQAMCCAVMYYVGSAVLVIPSTLAAKAGRDGWISAIAAISLHLLIIPICMGVNRIVSKQGILGAISGLLGKAGGRIVLILFVLLFPYLIFCLTLRNLGDFLTGTLLRRTPMEADHVVMLVVVVFAVRWGIEAIGRAGELLLPIVYALAAIYFLSLVPNLQPAFLLPVGFNGLKPIAATVIPFWAFPYMEGIILCMLTPYVAFNQEGGSGRQLYSFLWKSGLYSGILLFLITIITIMELGGELTRDIAYPSYFLASTISIAQFFERIEAVLAVIWFITIFFRLTLLLFVSSSTLGAAFGFPDYKGLAVLLAACSLPISLVVWPNSTYLLEFVGIWPFYAVLFGVVAPFLLAAGWRIKTRYGRRPQAEH